jgi:hypothetical protein
VPFVKSLALAHEPSSSLDSWNHLGIRFFAGIEDVTGARYLPAGPFLALGGIPVLIGAATVLIAAWKGRDHAEAPEHLLLGAPRPSILGIAGLSLSVSSIALLGLNRFLALALVGIFLSAIGLLRASGLSAHRQRSALILAVIIVAYPVLGLLQVQFHYEAYSPLLRAPVFITLVLIAFLAVRFVRKNPLTAPHAVTFLLGMAGFFLGHARIVFWP